MIFHSNLLNYARVNVHLFMNHHELSIEWTIHVAYRYLQRLTRNGPKKHRPRPDSNPGPHARMGAAAAGCPLPGGHKSYELSW
jgi:hypothetical protein